MSRFVSDSQVILLTQILISFEQPEKIAKSKMFTSMLEKLVNAGKLGL